MRLEIEIFLTPSGKPKQRGRNNTAQLIPDNDEESERLEQARSHGRLTRFSGSANWERSIDDLRNMGKAIDPNLRELRRVIGGDGYTFA